MSKPVQTFVFLFTFLFLFSALCVQSTTVFKMNVPELVKGSCAIVIGEVEKIDKDFEEVPGTSPEEGLEVINTSLKIRVEKILKGCGKVKEGEIVEVRRVGGQIEELDMRVPGAPTFMSKRRVLLFLMELPNGEHAITGFSQGKFRILEEAGVEVAVQDKNARHLMLLNGATGKETSKETPDRMPLETLLKEVQLQLIIDKKLN